MRILLAEDDTNLNHSLSFQLKQEQFLVDSCFDGEETLYYALQGIHDIILLDRMLPLMDGITILQKIREQHIQIPVIFITALGALNDKITGLDYGADDYLVKPFAFEELMARIRSITRRPRNLLQDESILFHDVTYTIYNYTLTGPLSTYTLSKKEGLLLETFLRNKEQIISRSTLLTKIWGPEYEVEEGNLDNYIHFIRRRLISVGSSLSLKTIRGIGYQLTL